MKFYAFDSFEGLPEIKGVDVGNFKHFEQGQFTCSEAQFKDNIKRRGVDLGLVTIIPGWYNQVLTTKTKETLLIKKAAIVWIDCDIYESTIPVLDFLIDYVQDGTIIIFDDWFCFRGNPNRGEQRAFREWLGRNPQFTAAEFYRFDWGGNSFIIHTNVGSSSF